jgi:cardiolipin synthase
MKKSDGRLLLKKLKASWQKAFLNLIPFGGFSYNNSIEIFHSGDEAFGAIFKAIEQASKSIYVETYILAQDDLGLKFRELLIKAQNRGVLVTVLYDHFGSAKLSQSFLLPLLKSNIKVVVFNPIWPWRRHGPLLFRDHRKIIVIDEVIAFCGGMNISSDYAGPNLGTNFYRDTTAQIIGPAVKDLLEITKESILESEFDKNPEDLSQVVKSKIIDRSKAIKLFFKRIFSPEKFLEPMEKTGVLIQVLSSNTRRNLNHIQKSIEESVNRAVSYCYFTTPYFLPSDGLRKALINAKKRRVDVRILTAGLSDIPLMRYASRHIYKSFLDENIRIYEMDKKTLHAKLATIDGIYSLIGSYNLDHWSARRNLEVSLAIIDKNTALDLKEQFKIDLLQAHEINKTKFFARSYFRRFICWLAYLLMRI